MSLQQKPKQPNQVSQLLVHTRQNPEEPSDATSNIVVRLEELEALPHRNRVMHWAAFTLSLLSLILLGAWVFSSRAPVPAVWIWLDAGLSVVFAIEFFTRSGFRWSKGKYLRTRFFEFIAIIPVLALVHHGFALEGLWVWIILVVRAIRVIDRFLGDGFVSRNVLALVEGFEEEITDRVLERIIARVQADMDRVGLSHSIAAAILRNKPAVLKRVREATPHKGLVPELAHIVGLDAALERAEESSYDAIVGIVNSEEIDTAVRDVVNSLFSRMSTELHDRSWRKHLGIKNHHIKKATP